MGTRVVILVLTLAFVVTPAFAAPTAETKTVEPGSAKPQYGGTLTYLTYLLAPADMTHPDLTAAGIVRNYVMPYAEALIKGDVDKYGPRGSKEYPFQAFAETPYEVMSGQLAETWEVYPDKLVFHIRKGVQFYADKVTFMKTREMTADDVVFSLNRWITSATGKARIPYAKKVYAQDKYTVVVETEYFDFTWFFWIGYYGGAGIIPPEVVKAGITDWRNQVGTGPFVLTSAVKGSAATFERNPVYWDKTKIDGVEYKLPFADKLVIPVIVDEMTMVSALRTGKLDGVANLPARYAKELAKTNPELKQSLYAPGQKDNLYLQCRRGVFQNINVRKAIAMATDREELRDKVFDGHAEVYHLGGGPGFAAFTPLDKAPEAVRQQYTYDPTQAKKMLADAGYPNGFETEIVYTPELPYLADMVSVLRGQWQKVGVTVKPVAADLNSYRARAAAFDFSGGLLQELSVTPRGMDLLLSKNVRNYAGLVNDAYDKQFEAARGIVDGAQRNALLRSALMDWTSQATQIMMPTPFALAAWWPWVRNYYGEITVGFGEDMSPILARMWIDTELKKKMGH